MKNRETRISKRNSVTLYLVTTDLNNNLENILKTNILYITENKDIASEFVIKKLIDENRSHFSLWCLNHNMDEKDSANWVNYMKNVLREDQINKYNIVKAVYPAQNVAEIFRLYTRCENF